MQREMRQVIDEDSSGLLGALADYVIWETDHLVPSDGGKPFPDHLTAIAKIDGVIVRMGAYISSGSPMPRFSEASARLGASMYPFGQVGPDLAARDSWVSARKTLARNPHGVVDSRSVAGMLAAGYIEPLMSRIRYAAALKRLMEPEPARTAYSWMSHVPEAARVVSHGVMARIADPTSQVCDGGRRTCDCRYHTALRLIADPVRDPEDDEGARSGSSAFPRFRIVGLDHPLLRPVRNNNGPLVDRCAVLVIPPGRGQENGVLPVMKLPNEIDVAGKSVRAEYPGNAVGTVIDALRGSRQVDPPASDRMIGLRDSLLPVAHTLVDFGDSPGAFTDTSLGQLVDALKLVVDVAEDCLSYLRLTVMEEAGISQVLQQQPPVR